uniref:Uncharacterized protein n=1 Tax=Rhipicephalus zambeziensis TaxID=60191 RepID=A0A224YBA6_9ACAR
MSAYGGTPWQEAHQTQMPLLIYVGYEPVACYLLFDIKQPTPAAPKRVRTDLCMKRGHSTSMLSLPHMTARLGRADHSSVRFLQDALSHQTRDWFMTTSKHL